MSNGDGFLPVLPASVLEQTLIVDYLLSQGFCFDDLYLLSSPEREQVFTRACQFAHSTLEKVFPAISLAQNFHIGFSNN